MNIPNIITTVRLALIPVFIYFSLIQTNLLIAAIVFIISGVSDVADGFIARKFNMITDFGKLYDPVVDKLFQIAAVACLYIKDILPIWIIFFIIFKESVMIIASIILYYKKVVVHSFWYGKAATVIFYAAIFFMLITKDVSSALHLALLCVVAVSAVLSAIGYFFDFVVKKPSVKK